VHDRAGEDLCEEERRRIVRSRMVMIRMVPACLCADVNYILRILISVCTRVLWTCGRKCSFIQAVI